MYISVAELYLCVLVITSIQHTPTAALPSLARSLAPARTQHKHTTDTYHAIAIPYSFVPCIAHNISRPTSDQRQFESLACKKHPQSARSKKFVSKNTDEHILDIFVRFRRHLFWWLQKANTNGSDGLCWCIARRCWWSRC